MKKGKCFLCLTVYYSPLLELHSSDMHILFKVRLFVYNNISIRILYTPVLRRHSSRSLPKATTISGILNSIRVVFWCFGCQNVTLELLHIARPPAAGRRQHNAVRGTHEPVPSTVFLPERRTLTSIPSLSRYGRVDHCD